MVYMYTYLYNFIILQLQVYFVCVYIHVCPLQVLQPLQLVLGSERLCYLPKLQELRLCEQASADITHLDTTQIPS